ncbi:MAG: glycoside hydrolase family 32 protein [Verrucomicrobiales bacterium]
MKLPLSSLAFFLLAGLGTIHAADAPAQPATINPAATPAAKQEPPDFDKSDAAAHLAFFLQNRKSAAADPYRPIYHFSPPGFGLHDPAGLCKWQGKYHLFYLYSPSPPDHLPGGGLQWSRGHAVSDDLVHWRDLPLLPTSIRGGTGQAWADNDRVILTIGGGKLFTSSDPLLHKWTEHPVKFPGGDNFIWREKDHYYITRPAGGPNTTLEILRSKDLSQWDSMGNYLSDGYFTDPGTDCSCNNVLSLGNGKHLILFFSHNRGPEYYLGISDLEPGRFAIEHHGRMNYGPVMRGGLHAPTGFVDSDGRCIGMWNIMECTIDDNMLGTKDEMVSLPRVLTANKLVTADEGWNIRPINPLTIEPVEELKKLRFNPVKVENVVIPANGQQPLAGVEGRAMELEAVIDPKSAREVGLRILQSPNGEEQTTISLSMHGYAWPWKSNKRHLMIDVSQASLSPAIASRVPEIGPLYLKDGEPLHLRVFIDRSVIEVFANGRQCLTLRAYPTRPDSTQVSVFARGSEARLVSLTAWQMRSVWPELKDKEGR